MAAYRVPEFTLEQRVDVALHMLNPNRIWGVLTGKARPCQCFSLGRNLARLTRRNAPPRRPCGLPTS